MVAYIILKIIHTTLEERLRNIEALLTQTQLESQFWWEEMKVVLGMTVVLRL